MVSSDGTPALRQRVAARQLLLGTFVKTTSHQPVEVLGRSGMDFVVLDAEHAPFGRSELDRAIAGAATVGLPVLVRIPDHTPAFINACMDMGAAGILVPHTVTGQDAAGILDAIKYGRGRRGFSPSGRAGSYGQVNFADFRHHADLSSTVWCQIEDVAALERLDEIAAVEDIDCLFIGPADLSMSLGASGSDDPKLIAAIDAIVAAGLRHDRAVGMYVASAEMAAQLVEKGITVFVCGSDQSLMLAGAKRAAQTFAEFKQ